MSIQDIKLASGSKLNDKSNINPNKTKYCRFIQAKKVEVPDIVMAIHPHLEGEFWGPTVDLLLDENVVTGVDQMHSFHIRILHASDLNISLIFSPLSVHSVQ